MSHLNSTERMPPLQERVSQIAQKFLSESWAQKNDLGPLLMGQIGEVLEEAKESFEKSEDLSTTFLRERASLDACIEYYCSLLLLSETHGLDLSQRTLNSLIEALPPNNLPFDSNQSHPDEIHSERETAILWGNDERNENLAPVSLEKEQTVVQRSHAPSQTPEFQQLVDALSDIGNWKVSQEPPPRNTKMEGDSPEVPNDIASDAETTHTSAQSSYETNPESQRATQSLIEEEFSPPHALTNKRAREFWLLHAYFQKQEPSWPLEKEHLRKIIGQYLCYSIEMELIERLETSLKQFWLKREVALRQLLNHGSRKFELHPSLRAALAELSNQHPDWLPSEGFPAAAVLTSLRYLLATLQQDSFEPSLMEAGILIFFFGQNTQLSGFPLQNSLHVSGLSQGNITELFFRLCRLNRSRAKVLGAGTHFSTEELNHLLSDCQSLVVLLERLHIGEDFTDREAA